MKKFIFLLICILLFTSLFTASVLATDTVELTVSVSAESLYNHSVGSDWRNSYVVTVDGRDYQIDDGESISVSYTLGDEVGIYTYIEEYDDARPDTGDYYSTATFGMAEICGGTYSWVTHNVTVVENGGRYSGNTAEWEVIYTFESKTASTASDFLREKAEEQRERIDEEWGSTAYMGSDYTPPVTQKTAAEVEIPDYYDNRSWREAAAEEQTPEPEETAAEPDSQLEESDVPPDTDENSDGSAAGILTVLLVVGLGVISVVGILNSKPSRKHKAKRATPPQASPPPPSPPKAEQPVEKTNGKDKPVLKEIASAYFSHVGYDEASRTLTIVFRESGAHLIVYDFPWSAYIDFMMAPSMIDYFEDHIRGEYRCDVGEIGTQNYLLEFAPQNPASEPVEQQSMFSSEEPVQKPEPDDPDPDGMWINKLALVLLAILLLVLGGFLAWTFLG